MTIERISFENGIPMAGIDPAIAQKAARRSIMSPGTYLLTVPVVDRGLEYRREVVVHKNRTATSRILNPIKNVDATPHREEIAKLGVDTNLIIMAARKDGVPHIYEYIVYRRDNLLKKLLHKII